MASNTPNLNLLKKDPIADGNDTFNIQTMLNENWDKIDAAVGEVREELGDIEIPPASLNEPGIVQLSNATNGTRENVAATEKVVGQIATQLTDVSKKAQAAKDEAILTSNINMQNYSMNKVAKYQNGSGVEIDPNTTTDSYIVTTHANTPSGKNGYYWHITTFFFQAATSTTNRYQIALSYNLASTDPQMYFRQHFNGVWSAWRRVADWTTHQQLAKLTESNGTSINLASGTNLNNVKTGGFYNGSGLLSTPAATLNAPGSGWWYLTVQAHSNDPNNWVKQTIREFGTNKVWERTLMSGTWSSWVLLNPYTPTQVIYVDVVNGNDSNSGVYGSPLKTISKALAMLKDGPIILPWGVTIRLAPGTYNETYITITQVSGHSITIEADGSKGGNKSNVIINGIVGMSQSSLYELNFLNVTFSMIFDIRTSGASFVSFGSCIFNTAGGPGANLYGAIVGGNAKYYFTGCTFNGKQTAINALNGSWVFLSSTNNGSGNTTGVWAEGGSIVTISGVVSLGASTAFKVTEGAQIFNTPNGVIRTT